MAVKRDHWAADRLGRKQDAEFLYSFLIGQFQKRRAQGRTASYVLNVDADWGGGKTFFLDGLAQDIEARGHLVARINAWRDDHAQDPYVAIMAAIDKAFAPFVKKPGKVATAWTAAKSTGGAIALRMGGAVLKGLLKKHTGVSVDELADIVADQGGLGDIAETVLEEGSKEAADQLEKLFDASLEAMIDGFRHTDEAMADFRLKLEKAIASISADKAVPLFVLVDELDRCRPTYAVQLLERVKHLFEVEGVIFVFATNADQLQHSVAGAYGANFNGFRYLKRFFERTYVFEAPSIEEYIASLCETLPIDKIRAPEGKLAEVLAIGCKSFGFDLRAIAHVIDMIDAAASAWPHKIPMEIAILFPVCAFLYQEQKAVWPPVTLPPLEAWTLPRHYVDQLQRRKVDRSIYLGKAYGTAVGIFDRMEKIMSSRNSNRTGATEDYILQAFNPEFNGIVVDSRKPSIQTEILGFVTNAGKMLKEG